MLPKKFAASTTSSQLITIKRRLTKLKRVPLAVEVDVVVLLAIGVDERLNLDDCHFPEDFEVAAGYPHMVIIVITGWFAHEDVRAGKPVCHPGNPHLQSSLSYTLQLQAFIHGLHVRWNTMTKSSDEECITSNN
jgi:hypothetical protein